MLFLLLTALPLQKAYALENADCFVCHDQIDETHFKGSVHGKNLCTSCHAITEVPHPEKVPPVNCANCHRMEAHVYAQSDHGIALKAGAKAAACLDCHGEHHGILSARNPASPMYRANIPKTCATCHEDDAKMSQYRLLEKKPMASYSHTVHGKALMDRGVMSSAVCTDCHGSHDLHAPNNPKSKIFRGNVPATCGKCHENVYKTYERSSHGQAALSGKREAPVCTDCHGEHNILSHLDPKSSVYSTTLSEKVCGYCHSSEKINAKYDLPSDSLQTYLNSYHGLAGKAGQTTVANCASCHGAHNVLPASDPESMVNKKNLPTTCGRCHPNVSEQLAKGTVHVAPSFKRNQIVFVVTVFYILLIVGVLGGMLVHNLLDFIFKLRKHYREKRLEGKPLRFTRGERVQHWLLVVSFFVLAYSGFALKFPEVWWTIPFRIFKVDYDLRGLIHRGAALVFLVLCFYHGGYAFFTKRGRWQIKALLPNFKDFKDVIGMLLHNLGKSPGRPKLAHYSYIEKSEYWALVWGSVVMIITGAMLVFENITMQYLPKWALDVASAIHFYEAILAVSAIIVWHFYFVIFDPEHYPLNMSMISGKETEERSSDSDGESTSPKK